MIFSQDNDDLTWAGTVKFDPLAALFAGIVWHGFNMVVSWVPYISHNIGIPVEAEFIIANEIIGFGIMTGIEAVPIPVKEKNGLYVTAVAGAIFLNNEVKFGAKALIGYQWIFGKGFVLNPSIGALYTGFTGFSFTYSFDIGFAYRKRH